MRRVLSSGRVQLPLALEDYDGEQPQAPACMKPPSVNFCFVDPGAHISSGLPRPRRARGAPADSLSLRNWKKATVLAPLLTPKVAEACIEIAPMRSERQQALPNQGLPDMSKIHVFAV